MNPERPAPGTDVRSLLRARQDVKQIMKFITQNVVGAEQALGGTPGHEHRQVGQGVYDGRQPDECARSLTRAAPRYLATVRRNKTRVMTWSEARLTMFGSAAISRRRQRTLMTSCRPTMARAARFRQSLQSSRSWPNCSSEVVWLRVATGLREIPTPIWDALVERRAARRWTYEAP